MAAWAAVRRAGGRGGINELWLGRAVAMELERGRRGSIEGAVVGLSTHGLVESERRSGQVPPRL